jgi:hypothetical protein
MDGSNFMQGWVVLAGSLATIAIILMAFGLMLGIVKPADALRRVAAILGIVMLLMVIPAVLVNIWSDMSLWQRLALAGISHSTRDREGREGLRARKCPVGVWRPPLQPVRRPAIRGFGGL